MRVVFTDDALQDPKAIYEVTAIEYPASLIPSGKRFRASLAMVAMWPKSARLVRSRSDVRVSSLSRYPFRIFYRAYADRIEIARVLHVSRQLH